MRVNPYQNKIKDDPHSIETAVLELFSRPKSIEKP
jgi:hypothetical protein